MRKITAALIGTALAATTLAGCAPAPGTSSSLGCTPLSSGDGTVLSNVAVTGEFGSAPKIAVPNGFTVTEPERAEVISGTGEQITALSQVASFELTLINTTDGSVINSSEYSGSANYAPVGGAVPVIPSFGDAMMCARAGSRVVAAFPSSELDPSTASSIGLTQSTGIVAIVDVIDVMMPAANGAPVFNSAWGLPAVVRTPAGAPGVVVPTAPAPKSVTVQTLLKGDGAALTKESQAVINVLGTTWEPDATTGKRTTFVNSWTSAAPQAVSLADPAALPAGFDKALTGATIGSQLLLVVPAAENPADGASGTPTDATLIYVIDVVGTL